MISQYRLPNATPVTRSSSKNARNLSFYGNGATKFSELFDFFRNFASHFP
jgi:hypothetical protein